MTLYCIVPLVWAVMQNIKCDHQRTAAVNYTRRIDRDSLVGRRRFCRIIAKATSGELLVYLGNRTGPD